MRTKRSFAAFACAFALLSMGMFSKVGGMRVYAENEKTLIAGGELFGVSIRTDGVLVTSLSEFESGQESVCPGQEAGLRPGDLILKANGVALESAEMLSQVLAASNGAPAELLIRRGEQDEHKVTITARKSDEDHAYHAGIYVRDRMSGVGTLTYFDPETGAFAGLGHGICDAETETLLPVRDGQISRVRLEGIVKGQSGSPGELQGAFEKGALGQVYSNHETGVYGLMEDSFSPDPEREYPIARKDELHPGSAELLCGVSDMGVQSYEIEISEICDTIGDTKNFLVRVTDPGLLALTGGIVQGMSGSPILQDGKLVGALTHVLVNHPERGYGILIENMLSTARRTLSDQTRAAS